MHGRRRRTRPARAVVSVAALPPPFSRRLPSEQRGFDHGQLHDICKALSVSEDTFYGELGFNERKLLEIEIAAACSEGIVLEHSGHDPAGVQRIHQLTGRLLPRKGFIQISFPTIPSRTCFPGATCLEVQSPRE